MVRGDEVAPQVFHGRHLVDGDHQLVATPISDASTTANYFLHTWQTNGKKEQAYLTGSVDLLGKSFAPGESLVVDIEPFGFGSTLGTLMIQNASGGFQCFYGKEISFLVVLLKQDISNRL